MLRVDHEGNADRVCDLRRAMVVVSSILELAKVGLGFGLGLEFRVRWRDAARRTLTLTLALPLAKVLEVFNALHNQVG